MTFKEGFVFIARCLSAHIIKENYQEVKQQIESENVDWDLVVQISTSQLVFPALYINLLKTNLTALLPQDLLAYMEHITQLNRDRNEQIITEANHLHQIAMENNIKLVFLKGTSYLLSGLYEDIGERMIGDIDFLVDENEALKINSILIKNGYKDPKNICSSRPDFRHLPRLIHDDYLAAIEIHTQVTIQKYLPDFHPEKLIHTAVEINKTFHLTASIALKTAAITHQINSNGNQYKSFSLRNAYDLLLLDAKYKPSLAPYKNHALHKIVSHYEHMINSIFKANIKLVDKNEIKISEQQIQRNIENYKKTKNKKTLYWFSNNSARLKIAFKTIYDPTYRNHALKKLSSKEFYISLFKLKI